MSVLRTLVSYISFPGMYVVSCHKKIPAVSINRVSSDTFTLLQINKDFKRRFWHLIYNKGHDLTREQREECLVHIKDVRRRELQMVFIDGNSIPTNDCKFGFDCEKKLHNNYQKKKKNENSIELKIAKM